MLLPLKMITFENVDFECNFEIFPFHGRVMVHSHDIPFFIFFTTLFNSSVTSWVLAHDVEHIEYLLNLASYVYETWVIDQVTYFSLYQPTLIKNQ